MGQNGKDEFIREFEDCKDRMGYVRIRWKEPPQKIVLRLDWGPGYPRDFDNGTMAGGCFPPRPYASLEKNVVVFLRYRSMILQRRMHRPRYGKGGAVGAEGRVDIS